MLSVQGPLNALNRLLLAAFFLQLSSCGDQAPEISSTNNVAAICKQSSLLEGASIKKITTIYNQDGDKIPDSLVNSNEVNWQRTSLEKNSDINGVGRFGNCSATLIETSELASGPAYILTNGHCVGSSLPSHSGAVVDVAAVAGRTMSFNYFNAANASEHTIVLAKTVKFASMDKSDVALVELDASLGDLKAQGINAFKLAKERPIFCEKIRVLGVPLQGMRFENIGLRSSTCELGEEVALLEGPYSFPRSFRHNCSIVGGSSGSPVFRRDTMEVVGVVNTTVNDSSFSKADCSLNRPCEVNGEHQDSVVGVNYGQYTDFMSGCFDINGVFDIDEPQCGLKAYFQI